MLSKNFFRITVFTTVSFWIVGVLIFGLSGVFADEGFQLQVKVWPVPQETATGTVDSTTGGEVTLSTAGGCVVSVSFPSEAVTASTDVFIDSISEESIAPIAPIPSDLNVVSDLVYDFKAEADGQTITTFDQPVTLTFIYTDAQISGLDESSMRVYYWNTTQEDWIIFSDYTLDTANNIITINTSHFTLFVIMASSPEEEEAPPPSGGGGGGGARVAIKVIFQGKAYPNSSITVLKDGKIATTVQANSKADFRAEIANLTAGIYTFGVWAKDRNNIKSITYTLTFRVSPNTTTMVSGIYLSPTIDLDKTSLQKGEILNIFGQTVPEVEVDVHILSPEIIEKTQTDEIGAWLLTFNTQPLEEGTHITKARFNLNEEERSGFSGLLTFYIGEGVLPEELCPRADLNKDGRTNLIDFSILLYWWGTNNARCDQNQNGIVDLPDFSIMMYYWTG